MSAIIALAACSVSWRRGSCSRACFLLALERNRRVHLAGSFWSCIVSARTGPGSGCRGARSCSL